MPNENQQGNEPAIEPTPAPAPAPVVVDVSSIPDEALKDRLDRAKRQALKDTGFASVEEAKAARERLATIEAEEEARRVAAMSEQEKLAKAVEAERAEKVALMERLAAQELRATILAAANQHGIKNLEYAEYLAAKAQKADPNADVAAILEAAAADVGTKAALGIATEAPPMGAPPATTSPAAGGGQPKPAPSGSPTAKTARDMSPDEWRAYKRSIGLSG